jgi:hypothetical protein
MSVNGSTDSSSTFTRLRRGLPAVCLAGSAAAFLARYRSCPPSVWRALFGKFFASPGFGFTKKSSTSLWDGGAFVKTDSSRYGPLQSLSVAKKDSYPLEVNAHHSPWPEATESCTLYLSVRDQIELCFKSGPLVLLVQWEPNCSKTPQKTQWKTPGISLARERNS